MATLIANKKVRRDFEIQETHEAGIELFGFEVKALRNKLGSLEGSHITVRGGEAFILNAHIPPFQPANTPPDYDSRRRRRLLLHKKQLLELQDKETQKGLTIVPISMYNKDRKIKVEVALVRGKKKFDKRQDIQKRDMQRETERSLKKRFR